LLVRRFISSTECGAHSPSRDHSHLIFQAAWQRKVRAIALVFALKPETCFTDKREGTTLITVGQALARRPSGHRAAAVAATR
jgi:hypothetical protein